MLGIALQLKWWQGLIVVSLFLAYLYHILIGGMKPKPLHPRKMAQRSIIYFALVLIFFNGIDTWVEGVCLEFVLVLALVKGVMLAPMKKVQKIENEWTISHGPRYIVTWLCFYGVKAASTAALVAVGGAFHIWVTCLYFALVSSVRSGIVCYRIRKKCSKARDATD